MSRSGYSDDCDNVGLWRGAVQRATSGYRGQHLLKKLRTALDAMPVKRLIADVIQDNHQEVCALGALDPHAPFVDDEYEQADALATHFGIASALAAEIVYQNDEIGERYEPEDVAGIGRRWRTIPETPEDRWIRMRAWVDAQITPDEPVAADAVAGTVEEGKAAPFATNESVLAVSAPPSPPEEPR